jgi:hypothetical protein
MGIGEVRLHIVGEPVGIIRFTARALLGGFCGQASEGMMGDAWAHGGEEGRGKLRKAVGRGTHPAIHRWPNGGTRRRASAVITGLSGEANPGN